MADMAGGPSGPPPEMQAALQGLLGGPPPPEVPVPPLPGEAAPAGGGDQLAQLGPLLQILLSALDKAYSWGTNLGASSAKGNATSPQSPPRDNPLKAMMTGSIPPQPPGMS